jgi:hypothetical protein
MVEGDTMKEQMTKMEEHLRSVMDQLKFHHSEVQIMISEKTTLDKYLTAKSTEMRDKTMNEVVKIENDMKRGFQTQHRENF